MEEEDFFSDDDFGDIPTNTLNELEQQALSSTQLPQKTYPEPQPHHQPSTRPPPLRKQAHNAASLNRAGGSGKNLPWRPPQSTRPSQLVPSAPPASAPRPPSSDYGFDDEDVIDLDEPSTVIQPALQLHPSKPQYHPHPTRHVPELDDETAAAFAAADEELGSQTFGRGHHRAVSYGRYQTGASMDVSALQARIAELEVEQARLRLAERQAKEEARAKQGEIAIVRSNQEKMTKQYEARMSVMQRVHADETSKAKAELETQRKEREKMETDNRFLQHDLAQEAERAKRANGVGRARSTQHETPRKGKRAMLGDGFDDGDLRVQPSPSRSRDDKTPKTGAKRKRLAHDSPVAALSFTQPPQPLRHESTGQSITSFVSDVPEPVVVEKDAKYEFLQLILNHSPHEGHDNTVDSLAKYSFPSKPDKTLSSIFLHAISYSTSPNNDPLPLSAARNLLKLWSRCLEEKYFAPFYLILDMLRFVLRFELSPTKALLIEEALPICAQTIDIIALPTVRASTNKSFAAAMDRKAFEALADEVDIERVLEFLQDLCGAASMSSDRNEAFWNIIEFHLVMMMTNKAHPISQVVTMLQMLGTSVRDTTFGPIVNDSAEQSQSEKNIVDRLTNMLFEMPDTPRDEPPFSAEEIMGLRLEVLKVFKQICQTDHGCLLLSHHRSVIGRWVRFLNAQVNRLYHARPSLGTTETDAAEPSLHDLTAQSVNLTVRLLYHLFRTNDTLEVVPKLNVVLGGYHKFLVSLTRIAFSEQLVFEAGIEDEVSEAAHAILDSVLGPEDGEAVMKAIETPRGTRGTIAEGVMSRRMSTRSASQRDETMSELG